MSQETLVSLEDLKVRLRIGEDAFVDEDNLTQALVSAEEYVAGIIKTELREGQHTDVFFVSAHDTLFDNATIQLHTTVGFLKDVTVHRHDKLNSDKFPAEPTLVSKEKGVITLPFQKDTFYTVTYSAGFNPSDALPSWLTNAILLATEVVYNLPSNGREARGTTSAPKQLEATLLNRIRLNTQAVKALNYAKS